MTTKTEQARQAAAMAFARAGKTIPQALRASTLARSAWAHDVDWATQAKPPADLPGALARVQDGIAVVLDRAKAVARSLGLEIVEVPDEPAVQYAEPTPWAAQEAGSRVAEDDLVQQIKTAEAALEGAPAREQARLLSRIASLKAELARRRAGAATPGAPLEATAPSGNQYAAPVAWHASDTDAFPDAKNPDGDPRGDATIIRRRRLLALERQLHAMPFADREGSAGAALRAEIEQLHQQERQERDEGRRF